MQIFSLIEKEASIEQNRNRKSDKDFFPLKMCRLSSALGVLFFFLLVICGWTSSSMLWSNPNRRRAPQKGQIRTLRLGFGLPLPQIDTLGSRVMDRGGGKRERPRDNANAAISFVLFRRPPFPPSAPTKPGQSEEEEKVETGLSLSYALRRGFVQGIS